MRNFLAVFFVFLFLKSSAQNDSIPRLSLAFHTAYPIAFGDNFLSKVFTPQVGFGLNLQYNLNRFFVGFNFQSYKSSLKNKTLYGSFDSAETVRTSGFIGVRQRIKSTKLYLEHGIGVGQHALKSYGEISKYANVGQSVFIFSRCNYRLSNNFDFYASTEFEYTTFYTNIDGPYKKFYTKTYQIIPVLGIKFNMGTPKKLKWMQF